MGSSIFPASNAGRLVCKPSTAGQLGLPTTGAVVISASNSAWPAWSTLLASTAAEYYLTGLTAWATYSAVAYYLRIQVGTGAAGAETVMGEVVLPTDLAGSNYRAAGHGVFAAPLRIPISTRLAVRAWVPGAAAGLSTVLMALATPYAAVEGN